MGYDLRNQSGTFHLGTDTFTALLELAERHGWQSAGTMLYRWREGLPDSLDTLWIGAYLSNDGQKVSAEDAVNIAAAIEQALDDIPDVKVPHTRTDDTYGRFSGGEWKDDLRGFIAFCRGGAFVIN